MCQWKLEKLGTHALVLPLKELKVYGKEPTDLLDNRSQEQHDGGATERGKKEFLKRKAAGKESENPE